MQQEANYCLRRKEIIVTKSISFLYNISRIEDFRCDALAKRFLKPLLAPSDKLVNKKVEEDQLFLQHKGQRGQAVSMLLSITWQPAQWTNSTNIGTLEPTHHPGKIKAWIKPHMDWPNTEMDSTLVRAEPRPKASQGPGVTR